MFFKTIFYDVHLLEVSKNYESSRGLIRQIFNVIQYLKDILSPRNVLSGNKIVLIRYL